MDKELINSHTKIKICGMTCDADIKAVNTYLPDYIGFVLFFPKSNRNISIEQAEHLLEKVDKKIRTVAVVVSPTTEQIRQLKKLDLIIFKFMELLLKMYINNASFRF